MPFRKAFIAVANGLAEEKQRRNIRKPNHGQSRLIAKLPPAAGQPGLEFFSD